MKQLTIRKAPGPAVAAWRDGILPERIVCFTATALQTPMRMPAHRASDHLKILCQVGVLQRQSGYDKRETDYFIRPGFVRKAENGTAIFDFGSGQLHFPRVRLPE